LFADHAVDFHGERGREGRARGLDDDAVRVGESTQLEESRTKLPNEVAADAAIEQLTDTGNRSGGGELGVDGEVAEFVLEKGKL
jgi:hypothetical protein